MAARAGVMLLGRRHGNVLARRGLASSSAAEVKVELPKDTFQVHGALDINALPNHVTMGKNELVQMYKDMVLMRRMETAADQLYKQKLIRGFCHLNNGQEAISVGIKQAIGKQDAVITAYRCHGFALMMGASPTSILAELLGRKDGATKGKGGSMHIFARNFYGGNGIVGAQVPVGAGIAFAQKYRNEKDAMTIALYGDGAANQGQVFEAYNMAALWKLPVIFACENNGYGMGTSVERHAASKHFFKRGGDYVPGVKVNGMDSLAVYAATRWAKENWFAKSMGPLVFEFTTYRYAGHSMSDPGTSYRTRQEVGEVRSSRDPIANLRQLLLTKEVTDEDSLRVMERDAKTEIDAAVAAATASPEPDPTQLYTDVYVEGTEPASIRGLDAESLHRFHQQQRAATAN